MKFRSLLSASVVLSLSATLAACSAEPPATAVAGNGVDASTATSAADFGGLDALVSAAQEEGELNVIALPEDWANYGAIITGFEDKYDITVNSANPNASSAEEIQAAENQAGQDTAPDVFLIWVPLWLWRIPISLPHTRSKPGTRFLKAMKTPKGFG